MLQQPKIRGFQPANKASFYKKQKGQSFSGCPFCFYLERRMPSRAEASLGLINNAL